MYITTVKILFYMFNYTEELHYNTSVYAVENSNFLPVADTVYNKNTHFVLTISILKSSSITCKFTISRCTVFKNTLDTQSFFAQMII